LFVIVMGGGGGGGGMFKKESRTHRLNVGGKGGGGAIALLPKCVFKLRLVFLWLLS